MRCIRIIFLRCPLSVDIGSNSYEHKQEKSCYHRDGDLVISG